MRSGVRRRAIARSGRCLLSAGLCATPLASAQPTFAPPASVQPASVQPTSVQPKSAPALVLPEVTVSASRVERDPMDLPVSIDVVDQREIREANVQVNLSEALGRVPGIAVQNRHNYAQDLQLSSRGFGARAAFGVRGLRLIADGIPATMPDGQGQAASFNLGSAQRIEVMRGPFSTLYGNAAGGVVQIFTADGPERPTYSLRTSAGRFGTWTLGSQFGGQQGALNLRVDASRFSTDGYRERSAARRDQANAKLTIDLAGSGTLTLVANRLDQPDTGDPLGLTAAQVAQDRRQAGTGAAAFATRKRIGQSQAGLTWDLPLANGDRLFARAYAGDRQVTQHLAIPLAAQAAPTSGGGVVDLDRVYAGLGLRWTRGTALAGRPATLTAGIDVDRMDERRRGFLNENGTTGALKRDQDDTVGNTDFYSQLQWQLSDRVGLLAGLRHSRVGFESRDDFISAGNPDDSGAVDFVRTTPVAGLTWRLSPLVNVYANAGRGFETPTFAELAYRPGGASGLNLALKPSRSLHREIGIKVLTGSGGRLNLAAFRIDTRDEIVVNSAAGGRSDFRNAAGTRREGFELAWQQALPAGFEMAVAWTLLDARFQQSFTSGVPVLLVPAGRRLPGVAPSLVFGELVWRDAGSGFYTGLEVRQSGKVFVNDRNSESADGYTIANLRTGFRQQGPGWRVDGYVRVDNLTDRAYIGSVIVADANGRFYEPAPGRAVTVGLALEISL